MRKPPNGSHHLSCFSPTKGTCTSAKILDSSGYFLFTQRLDRFSSAARSRAGSEGTFIAPPRAEAVEDIRRHAVRAGSQQKLHFTPCLRPLETAIPDDRCVCVVFYFYPVASSAPSSPRRRVLLLRLCSESTVAVSLPTSPRFSLALAFWPKDECEREVQRVALHARTAGRRNLPRRLPGVTRSFPSESDLRAPSSEEPCPTFPSH